MIILPEIVRNFSEVKLTDAEDDFFLQILSQWYESQLHDIYVRNENAGNRRSNEGYDQFVRDFERLEENLG